MKTDFKILPHELGFDLDGVIADTAAAFLKIACEEHNYCSFTLEDITNFELEHCIGMPKDTVEKIFLDILKDSLATGLQPMPGAIPVLNELAAKGPVTVITARPIKQPVIDWFDTFLPLPTQKAIKLVATGDHDDKLRYIKEHKLKYFIDDRAETCKELAREIIPLVYSHPWNRNRHDLATVENWQEIRELIVLD
ncbi:MULTISPECIES: 5' nucleotidase, NT5C type [Desulfosediminicola]|uniref:5' nucleotidase, NT5C type n=1 Tax=Desulfosediminicola TaxID=2886823 RepID=UPI0010ACA530|nr:HAD hydrolase-like protein [Desulfosediminicola ganghwensis]